MSEEVFWHSNPRKIAPYSRAYEQRQFEIDRMSHVMGAYVYEAVGSALSALGKLPHAYRSKSFLAEEEERLKVERMTEEERMEKVEELFNMLGNQKR